MTLYNKEVMIIIAVAIGLLSGTILLLSSMGFVGWGTIPVVLTTLAVLVLPLVLFSKGVLAEALVGLVVGTILLLAIGIIVLAAVNERAAWILLMSFAAQLFLFVVGVTFTTLLVHTVWRWADDTRSSLPTQGTRREEEE